MVAVLVFRRDLGFLWQSCGSWQISCQEHEAGSGGEHSEQLAFPPRESYTSRGICLLSRMLVLNLS